MSESVMTLRSSAAVCALLALFHLGCQTAAGPAARTVVRVVDSSALTPGLVQEYRQRLPQIDFQVVPPGPTPLALITQGDADIAIVLADTAYFAYASGQGPRGLRGLSVAPELPIHLIVRPEKRIRSVADLRGRTIVACIGCNPSRDEPGISEFFPGQIVRAFGVDPADVAGDPMPLDKATDGLLGRYDAAFVNFYYPAPMVSAAISRGARVLSLEGPAIERLRLEFPFLREVRIPPGTYTGHPDVIRTIGIDRLLLCRSDLDEPLAYTLTKAFVEGLGALSSTMHMSFRHMDMERAPASPLPLHAGAARYFRELELFR